MKTHPLESLEARLRQFGRVVIAVSGGVDSATLAVVAHRALGHRARMYHAVSPALQSDATERVRSFASREGWTLEIASGTTADDPRDYRLGLQAAREHRICHPYVDTGFDKRGVSTLALDVGELFRPADMDHPVEFSPYRRARAFLHAPSTVRRTHG